VDVDLNVTGDIKVEGINENNDSNDSNKDNYENRACNLSKLSDDEWHYEELLSGPDSKSETVGDEESTNKGQDVVHSRHL